MTVSKLALSSLVLLALSVCGCSPPTPEEACKAAADKFTKCAKSDGDKWGDKQIGICKADFAGAKTMQDYTKTLKKCSEMDDCEIATKCMMTILVAVGNDAKKN